MSMVGRALTEVDFTMNSLSLISAVAVVCASTTTFAAAPGITRTQIAQDRATIQGETNPSHELVLQIDDGSSEPRQWRSCVQSSGKFDYVVQVTDSLRLEGGKTGKGIKASCTVGNANATMYIPGEFKLRATASTSKDGRVTFADVQGDDGQMSPVSFRIEKKKL